MKIAITEAQYNKILEESISYTPEKIDQFVIEASKVLNETELLFNKYQNQILSLTVDEIFNSIDSYEKMAEKIYAEHQLIDKQHSKFYNIVDMYDFLDLPENVKKLEKINDRISDISEKIYALSRGLEEITQGVDFFKKRVE